MKFRARDDILIEKSQDFSVYQNLQKGKFNAATNLIIIGELGLLKVMMSFRIV